MKLLKQATSVGYTTEEVHPLVEIKTGVDIVRLNHRLFSSVGATISEDWGNITIEVKEQSPDCVMITQSNQDTDPDIIVVSKENLEKIIEVMFRLDNGIMK